MAKRPVGDARGTVQSWSAPRPEGQSGPEIAVVATVHPSAVLRTDNRQEVFNALVADLRIAARIPK